MDSENQPKNYAYSLENIMQQGLVELCWEEDCIVRRYAMSAAVTFGIDEALNRTNKTPKESAEGLFSELQQNTSGQYLLESAVALIQNESYVKDWTEENKRYFLALAANGAINFIEDARNHPPVSANYRENEIERYKNIQKKLYEQISLSHNCER